VRGFQRQPPPRLAAWSAGLWAPLQAAAPSGASRQACHAGGHAGRATQSRAVREFQRHPARRTARSTSARGPHDCALHLKPPPLYTVEHAARLAMPAVAPAERYNPERCGSFQRHPARKTAGSTARLRRRRNTIPSGTGVPTPSGPQDCALHCEAAPAERYNPERCGSFQRQPARKTAGSTARRRRRRNTIPSGTGVPTPSGPQDCALHLKPPPQVEQAARLAMPAVTPAEEHTPERYGSSKRHPARRTACSTSSRCPSGACRQACHVGGHAGRATQSRAVREFQSPTGPQDCALHLKPLP